MTDLLDVIPDFPSQRYSHLLTGLETHLITTTDLLTLDATEIARRAHLPILDLKHFVKDVISHLHQSYSLGDTEQTHQNGRASTARSDLARTGKELVNVKHFVSTLDDDLDTALNGGIAAGYVTEVTGESGAGKTQFLLTLLLAAQLSSPQGLGRGAIYISTEHALPTQRLQSLLISHPKLQSHPFPPSLKRILSIQIPDLETQDHILTYQLPVAVKSQNIGLIVIDSIAANYRAEAETSKTNDAGKSQAKNLAARSVDLVRTGALLRQIARENNCAIVVANQVADRFEPIRQLAGQDDSRRMPAYQELRPSEVKPEDSKLLLPRASGAALPHSSPIMLSQLSSSPSPMPKRPLMNYAQPLSELEDPRLAMDYQMRFFTGWGDDDRSQQNLKTPALGLTWANQITCRIAIIRESIAVGNISAEPDLYDTIRTEQGGGALPLPETGIGGADWSRRRWRRWMKVVFSGWTAPTEEGEKGVEFEVWTGGIRAVTKT